MILDFKSYILNESWRTPIRSNKELEKLVSENCKGFLEKGLPKIYRGDSDIGKYKLVDPKSINRRSANTSNYYTLLMDNLEVWKEFPKRSKSLICSTDTYIAETFGEINVVIPFDGCRIAFCPYGDLWDSFNFPPQNINYFLSLFNIKDVNYKDLIKDIKELSNKILLLFQENDNDYNKVYNELRKDLDIMFGNNNLNRILFEINEIYENNLYNFILDTIHPRNFKLYKYSELTHNDFNNDKFINKECWTDSKSILINNETFDKIFLLEKGKWIFNI
jgi:hypothetical protein